MWKQIQFQSKPLQHELSGSGIAVDGQVKNFLALADDALAIGGFSIMAIICVREDMRPANLRCSEWSIFTFRAYHSRK